MSYAKLFKEADAIATKNDNDAPRKKPEDASQLFKEADAIATKNEPSLLEKNVIASGRLVGSIAGDVGNVFKLPYHLADEALRFGARHLPIPESMTPEAVKEYGKGESPFAVNFRKEIEDIYDEKMDHRYKPEGDAKHIYNVLGAIAPLGTVGAALKTPGLLKTVLSPTMTNIAGTAAGEGVRSVLEEASPNTPLINLGASVLAGGAAGAPFAARDIVKGVGDENSIKAVKDYIAQHSKKGKSLAKRVVGSKIEAAIRDQPYRNYLEERLPHIFGLHGFEAHDYEELGKAALRASSNYIDKKSQYFDDLISELNKVHSLENNSVEITDILRNLIEGPLKQGTFEDVGRILKGAYGEELGKFLSTLVPSSKKASRILEPVPANYYGDITPYKLMNIHTNLFGPEETLRFLRRNKIDFQDLGKLTKPPANPLEKFQEALAKLTPEKFGPTNPIGASKSPEGKKYLSKRFLNKLKNPNENFNFEKLEEVLEKGLLQMPVQSLWDARKYLDRLISKSGWTEIGGNADQLKNIRDMYKNRLNRYFGEQGESLSNKWKKFNEEYTAHAETHVPWMIDLKKHKGNHGALFNEIYGDMKSSGQYFRYILEHADPEDAKKIVERAIYDLSHASGKPSLKKFSDAWSGLNKDVQNAILQHLSPEQANQLQKGHTAWEQISRIRGEPAGINQGIYNAPSLSIPMRVYKALASHVQRAGLQSPKGEEKVLRHLFSRAEQDAKVPGSFEKYRELIGNASSAVLENAEKALPPVKEKLKNMLKNTAQYQRSHPLAQTLVDRDRHDEQE